MSKKIYTLEELKFNLNLDKTNYEIDALQNRLLEFYIRADSRFRRAFSINYTGDFFQYLKDKARLREPIHIATIGNTRSGKSYGMITICCFHQACHNQRFSADYICGNAFEFLEKLKEMPEEELKDRIFLIDEEKQTIFGQGSMAKKLKLTDVQNIIAINNISTIMVNPISWANKDANYGLRTFGRCFNSKTIRMMLYNLSEKGRGSELPMGNIYIPIFTKYLPEEYAKEIEKEYLEKKNEWVRGEMRGEGDVLSEIKKKSAESFARDRIYLSIKTKRDRLTYIGQKLGSEWTKGEVEEIESITKLIKDGLLDEGD
jgi:hypothetical protein